MTFEYKFGKQDANPSPKALKLADFLDVERVIASPLPYHPHDTGFPLHMWANGPDPTAPVPIRKTGVGCCVWGGFCNLIQNWRHAAGWGLASLTGVEACGAYEEFAGYVLGDESTDNGTDMTKAMSQMRHTGLKDAKGNRHKIGAYLSITPGNLAEIGAAIRVFSAISIGIQFPSYAMQDFNQHKAWNYQAGGQIEGGHCIVLPKKGKAYSWAREFPIGDTFLTHYCDEAFAIISPEFLEPYSEKTPEGFDLAALTKILKTL